MSFILNLNLNSFQKYFPILIFLIAFLIRIPLYHTSYWADQDAIDYINVAENIKSGNGFISSIKWNFFTNDPVIVSAFSGRPVFTSLFFTGALSIINNVYFLQLIIFLIASLNAVLFYFLSTHFFSKKISFILSLCIALNPNILISNRLTLSEPIFLFFVLLSFLFYYNIQNTNLKYSIIGILIGLSYLTRIEGIFLLLVFMIFLIKKPAFLLSVLLFFIIVVLPYFYGNYLYHQNIFYSYNIYHFQTKHISEGYWPGFNKIFPSPFSFISHNFLWIVSAIFKRIIGNIQSLINLAYLGPLLLLALLSIKQAKKFLPVLLFGLLVFINYSVIWSAYFNPERHLIPVYVFLLLPIGSLFTSHSKRKYIVSFILILSLVSYFVLDIHRIVWARNTEYPGYMNNFYQRESAYQWILKNSNKNDIVSSWAPHQIYMYTKHPAIILPDNLDNDTNYEKFVNTYRVKYFFIENNSYTKYLKEKAELEFYKNGVWIYKTK